MAKKKNELKEEELDDVLGGFTIIDDVACCPYFFPALGKENSKKCQDCFYHHVDEKDNDVCSNPQVVATQKLSTHGLLR